jgi:N-acetylmuramoyl-L-alanine amidase
VTALRVVLDVQHAFRGGVHAGDRGSIFHDSLGKSITEVDLTLAYVHAARDAILEASPGALVFVNDPSTGALVGPYSQRAAWAAMRGPVHAYIACHVNAGGGDYGLVSASTVDLRRSLGLRSAVAYELSQVRLVQLASSHDSVLTRVLSRGDRGWPCVAFAAVSAPAVLFEPFFGDDALELSRFRTPEGARSIGRALARGIAASVATLAVHN